MTVALTRVLAALHLEHDDLVTFYQRVHYLTHYFCSLYGRSTNLHCAVSIYEQHLVKFNSLAFLGILDVMHKELLALFGLLYFKGFFREAAHVRAHFTLPQRTLTGCKGTNYFVYS